MCRVWAWAFGTGSQRAPRGIYTGTLGVQGVGSVKGFGFGV